MRFIIPIFILGVLSLTAANAQDTAGERIAKQIGELYIQSVQKDEQIKSLSLALAERDKQIKELTEKLNTKKEDEK